MRSHRYRIATTSAFLVALALASAASAAPEINQQGIAGQRWITGQSTYVPGARAIPLTFYETTGGAFDQPLPAPTSTVVGNGQLFFQACASAVLEYQFNAGSFAGQAGNEPLIRVGVTPRYCF